MGFPQLVTPGGLCLLPLSPLASCGSVLIEHRGDGAHVLWGVSSGWEPGFLPITSHECLLSPSHLLPGEGSFLPSTGSALHQGHSPSFCLSELWSPPRCLLLFIYLLGCVRSQLEHAGSFVVVQGFSSCGTWAYLLHSMWGLSSPTRGQTQVPYISMQIFFFLPLCLFFFFFLSF